MFKGYLSNTSLTGVLTRQGRSTVKSLGLGIQFLILFTVTHLDVIEASVSTIKWGEVLVSITMGYDDSAIMQIKHLPQHTNSRLFLTTRFGHHLRVAYLLTSRTQLPTCQAPHRFSPLFAALAQFSEGSQLTAE